MQIIIKGIISAVIIVGVAEIAKRYTPIAAILASLPMTSILAMIWLYHDTRDSQKVIDLSLGIFWAVLPSFLFFITLPLLLKSGIRFGWAMFLSCLIMFMGYSIYALIMSRFGIKI
ncbi:MAG: DUF3147 family protein [Candidatus Omnitrophica bacterium]|nr:DUF3147 family protein [Candidatus Omnitrophota bacterium]